MDDLFLKIILPLFGLALFVGVIKIVFEVMVPDLVHDWQNKRKFKAGEKWRSDRELIQWLQGMKVMGISTLYSNGDKSTRVRSKTHINQVTVTV